MAIMISSDNDEDSENERILAAKRDRAIIDRAARKLDKEDKRKAIECGNQERRLALEARLKKRADENQARNG